MINKIYNLLPLGKKKIDINISKEEERALTRKGIYIVEELRYIYGESFANTLLFFFLEKNKSARNILTNIGANITIAEFIDKCKHNDK